MDRCVTQGARRGQSSETATDNDNVWQCLCGHGLLLQCISAISLYTCAETGTSSAHNEHVDFACALIRVDCLRTVHLIVLGGPRRWPPCRDFPDIRGPWRG